ncbi:DUF1398 family protein [Streptomyces sp. NPDC048434]|uniref:DUF1398 family protein n=1 Tax=Streptomyces sp. NPDC048434 TaxID=3365549 RepID=UPI003710E4B0
MSITTDTLEAALERAAAVRPQVGGFPYLAEALRQAGITTYRHTVASATNLFLTGTGPVINQATPLCNGMTDVAPFDAEAVVTALRTDQAGKSSYPEFTRALWAAGVVDYTVDLAERSCTYRGATGENYVEFYPHVDI